MSETVLKDSPHGHCIFCEDIRQEIGGKETFVGVFNGPDLFVLGNLPTSIGKFSIKAFYAQRPTDVVAPVSIFVMLPGENEENPSARFDIDIPAMVREMPPPSPELEDPFLQVQVVTLLNPAVIKEEGSIRVRAVREGKSYKLGTIQVKTRLPDAPPPEKKEAAN